MISKEEYLKSFVEYCQKTGREADEQECENFLDEIDKSYSLLVETIEMNPSIKARAWCASMARCIKILCVSMKMSPDQFENMTVEMVKSYHELCSQVEEELSK